MNFIDWMTYGVGAIICIAAIVLMICSGKDCLKKKGGDDESP